MIKKCPKCHEEFFDKNATNCNARTYCSRKCSNRATMNGLKLRGIKKPERTAELHPNWKGDNITYGTLHQWVRCRLNKPKRCPDCKLIRDMELANLDHKYTRDIRTWQYKCVSCHRKYDYAKKGIFKGSKKVCVNGHEYTPDPLQKKYL